MATQTLRTRSWSPVMRVTTPYIPHPMSQMESRGDLTIRGRSTPVLRRENTVSFVDKGRVDRVVKKNGYYDDSTRLLHYPLDYLSGPRYKHVRQRSSPNLRGIPGDEIIEKVRDKLTTGFYGVRHMFRANDPLGKGNISRDAFLKVLYNLVGYITKEQFENLLERLDLENCKLISFNDFIRYFQDNETVKRQWIIPNKKLESQDFRRAMYPEENLRNLETMYIDPYHTAPYVAGCLRDKLNTGQVNIRDILPSACFQKDGMILAPQMREALAQLDLFLTNNEFEKFWSRFDRDHCGAVDTKQFYKLIGLTSVGQPKMTTTAITTSNSHRNKEHQSRKSEIVTTWSTEEKDGVRHDVLRTSYNYDVEDEHLDETKETKIKQEKSNDAKGRKMQVGGKPPLPNSNNVQVTRQQNSTTRKTETKVENSVNGVQHTDEDLYKCLLEGFQLFDYLNDGYIAKIDFRRVMKEFGFPIAATELPDLLSNYNIRLIRGQIDYKEFLKRFRNENTLNKIRNGSMQEKIKKETTTTTTTSTEKIDSSVVEHLHGDFLKLVDDFREVDPQNDGKVGLDTFRQIIEKQLGGALTDKQWRILQKDVRPDNDGTVAYPRFLAKFQITPAETTNGVKVSSSITSPDAVVDKLRHMASYMMKVKEKDDLDDRQRRIEEIHRKIEEILRTRFHTFDKHYKDMDRKQTGRMTKWQFGALLRLTGLILDQHELDRIWSTLNLAADGMLAYSSLIHQFNPAGHHRNGWTTTAPYALDDAPVYPERGRSAHRERKVTLQKRPLSAPSSTRPGSAASSANLKLDTSKLTKRKTIMTKIQPIVANNWEKLQQSFVRLDKQGYSNIGYMEMRSLMTQLNFGLNNQEMTEILDQFDLYGNGRFHYINFLEACYPVSGDREFFEEVHQITPSFIRKREEKVGDFNITSTVNNMRKKLLREWQNLRRAFRKMDSNNDGYLEVGDFKKCLRICNIDGSDEDMYHLFSEFDKNLTGKIAYKEFLQTLLSVR